MVVRQIVEPQRDRDAPHEGEIVLTDQHHGLRLPLRWIQQGCTGSLPEFSGGASAAPRRPPDGAPLSLARIARQ
jgi:hypothetical protein